MKNMELKYPGGYRIIGHVNGGCGAFLLNKQFKLIKEYPGSPPTGSIVTLMGNSLKFKPRHYFFEENEKLGSFFPIIHVENYPEYWEEIESPTL